MARAQARRLATVAATAAAALSAAAVGSLGSVAAAPVHSHRVVPAVGARPAAVRVGVVEAANPAVTFGCQATSKCYSPAQIRAAYGFDKLAADGAGRTIVIVDAFRSPTIAQDLATFDQLFGLPDPTLNVIAPNGGPAGAYDPNDPNQFGWAGEITLDVEWAHAIAPKATIDLVLAPSNQDSDILAVTKWAVDHNLGDVISQSFGEGETCMDPQLLAAQHKLFSAATAKGITLLASSGDQGSAQPDCNNDGGFFLSASTPASDPLVTSIGGTHLSADPSTGAYQDEQVWNESLTYGAAGGGGYSTLYPAPSYQQRLHVASRAVPDVAYNAAIDGGVLAVWSAFNDGHQYVFRFGGTSAGSPQWAGLVALADQLRGERLGMINNRLYGWGGNANLRSKLFHDVTVGDNTYTDEAGNVIQGYPASPGWDASTGLGTPKADALVPQLAVQ